MPHIKLKDKGAIDLFFEFLEPSERREFFEDLSEGSTIKLPDFGTVGQSVIENKVKELEEKDLTKRDEDFIKSFLREQQVAHPYLEYEKSQHSYKLKPKYDLERMMKEITTK